MKNYIKINNRKIGQGFSPYVIAEMSANHNGNIDTAFAIIEQAAISGADAVKIQTYKPDTITLESNLPDFRINEGLWKGRTLFELYDWAHTPWDWHKDLFNHAKKLMGYGKRVYFIEMGDKDPSELGFEQFTQLLHSAEELTMSSLVRKKLALS